MGFRVLDVDVVLVFVKFEGEEVELNRTNAVETPEAIRDGVSELFLDGADGGIVSNDIGGELFVGVHVLSGVQEGLAGSSMTVAV